MIGPWHPLPNYGEFCCTVGRDAEHGISAFHRPPVDPAETHQKTLAKKLSMDRHVRRRAFLSLDPRKFPEKKLVEVYHVWIEV